MGYVLVGATDGGGLLAEIPGLEIITDLIVHVILIGSTAAVIWVIVKLVGQDPDERAMRIVSVFTGALIVVGAEAAGVSYTSFIVDTLSIAKPLTFSFFAVLVPGLVGTTLAWYINANVKRNPDRAIRILILVLTLAVTQFLLTYVEALTQDGLEIGSYAVPNISFVVGVFLFMIFRSQSGSSSGTPETAAGWLDRLRSFGADEKPSPSERRRNSDRDNF